MCSVPEITSPFDVERILRQQPELTHFGFGVWPTQDFALERAALLSPSVRREIDRARAFIRSRRPRRSINRRASSYGVKHVAENWVGDYISNGSLLVAAFLEGVRVQRIGDTPNAWLALSLEEAQ